MHTSAGSISTYSILLKIAEFKSQYYTDRTIGESDNLALEIFSLLAKINMMISTKNAPKPYIEALTLKNSLYLNIDI